MNKERIRKRLKEKKRELEKNAKSFLGYPCNANLKDYRPLFDLLTVPFNNVGDPFSAATFNLHTRSFEREVLKFFAGLYKAPKNNFWGYVTSGGTEGNMYGLFLARELHPKGLLYFSKDSHYSIPKIARVLRMESEAVKSTPEGQIDLAELERLLRKNKKREPVLSLNIGTTMKGAVDDLDGIVRLLRRLKIKKYYIHCDAALYGMILPFLKKAPAINFTKPIGSIAVSGHKFIGSPVPCGVVLTKKSFTRKIAQKVEYIGAIDDTITGSRSALGPLILWYAIKTRGVKGFRKEANQCVDNAKYLKKKLDEMPWPAFLNPFSNTVLIERASETLIRKWALASKDGCSHVVVMQHATRPLLDRFLKDLRKDA